MNNKQIEHIVKKANSKEVKEECSPNVLWHQTIDKDQFMRILKALDKSGYKVVKK